MAQDKAAYVAPQSITFTCSGLRPQTVHAFYFDDQDYSSTVRQVGKCVGDDLVTGDDGKLTFEFMLGSGISANTDLGIVQDSLNRLAGNKVASVRTSDNSSYAAVSFAVLDEHSRVSDAASGGLTSKHVLSGG